MKRLVVMMAMLSGCDSMDECDVALQSGPGLVGTASYVLGDGSVLAVTVGTSSLRMSEDHEVTITGSVEGPWETRRTVTITIRNLSAGVHDLAGRGNVCLQRVTAGPVECAPLTGSVEVRELMRDCVQYAGCAQFVDLTLDLTSVWQSTTFTLDAEVQTEGRFETESC